MICYANCPFDARSRGPNQHEAAAHRGAIGPSPMARASLRRRGSLSVWSDPKMTGHAERSGKRGHPEVFSDRSIGACLTLKVLFGPPLRQSVGLVASLIDMAGLDWPVPDYSTLCRRQARLKVQIPYRSSGQPLNLLIAIEPVSATGSSQPAGGIHFHGDGEWLARKLGATRGREWRKVHLVMDTSTGDIRAVEFTSSRQGDSAILPELLSQTPTAEDIETVTADGAHDTRRCHAAIIEREAEPVRAFLRTDGSHALTPDPSQWQSLEAGLPGHDLAQ